MQVPVVGIARNIDLDTIIRILPAYSAAGLSTIEITMNSESATDIIRYAREAYGDQLNVGAGTVCTMAELHAALDAGADFIVTPVIDEPVIAHCVGLSIPIFPGAFTPSEIFRAWSLGAPMIKIFPATTLGPQYIRDVKAPLKQVKLLPTGGVSLHNMMDFMKAGASGLGIGSELFDKKLILAGNEQALLAHFNLFSGLFRTDGDAGATTEYK